MNNNKAEAEAQLNVQLQEAVTTGQLVVQVTDDSDPPQPIAGAQVIITDGTIIPDTTNTDGEVPPDTTNADGEVTLDVSFDGMELFATKDVIVTVTPPDGYTLSERSTQTVTAIALATIDVNLVIQPSSPGSRTLQVVRAGPGSGTVSSEQAGISCGEDCSEIYPNGTAVTLTATSVPGSGSVFSGWSGGSCSGTEPCIVTMDQNRTIIANFGLEEPTLQIELSGSGSGTVNSAPAGINCGTDCSEAYPFGTQVILRASPDPGEQFNGWSGEGCSGTTQPCTVTMDQDRTITATFSRSNPADLVPTPASSAGFCTRSAQGLIVRVQNQGLGDAAASTTRITFSTASGSSFQDVLTPTIAAGDSIDLQPIPIPPGCFVSDCSFVITVDFNDNVIESNEQNNQVDDFCLG